MEKDVARRFKELEKRLEQVTQLAAAGGLASDASSSASCPTCREAAETALQRADTFAAALRAHSGPINGDVRERIVTEVILSDLSASTARFREMLNESEAKISGILGEVQALGKEIDRVLDGMDPPIASSPGTSTHT